jgi:hypothetical protein
MTIDMILNGTECSIAQPLNDEFNINITMKKKKKHTIKYEIGVQIISGKIG